jgi:hypothetical protein
MFSYHDLMCFGLYADPDALPEVAELPTFLNSEILALAGPRNRRTRRAVEGRPAKNKASQRLRSVPV